MVPIFSRGFDTEHFLLNCNYDVALLETNLPLFYQELLQYFQEIKNATNILTEDEYINIIWNNKLITIDGNSTFYWKTWFERGVIFVQDILNANGNFLTYGEFVNRFNISTNYFHYFQLIAAVPNNLKKKATQTKG